MRGKSMDLETLKERENRPRKKRGCLVKCLIALGMLVLVVFVGWYAMSRDSGKQQVDERYITLASQSFDTTPFDSIITNTNKQEFYSKVRLSLKNADSYFVNNELNVAKIASQKVEFKDNLTLNSVDVTNLAELFVNSIVAIDNKFTSILNCSDIQKIVINQVESKINYSIIVKFKTEQFYLYANSINYSKVTKLYLTINATVDLLSSASMPIENVSMKVNELTGEDNAYCTDVILEAFGIKKYSKELAYLPFEYCKYLIALWENRYNFVDSNLIFYK